MARSLGAMSATELLDAYDADGRPLGAVPRDRVHREGLWHDAFHLWVVLGDGSVLLQRRAPHKESWPGHLDASAAGHLTAGEEVLDGLREAEEELGVAYAPDAVQAYGTERVEDLTVEGFANRERQHVFVVHDTRALADFTRFDRDEVTELVAVAAFGELVGGADVEGVAFDGGALRLITVARGELVPTPYLAGLAAHMAAP